MKGINAYYEIPKETGHHAREKNLWAMTNRSRTSSTGIEGKYTWGRAQMGRGCNVPSPQSLESVIFFGCLMFQLA
jgi:hypothetical protein